MMKFFFVALAISSSVGFAQDYYSPTNKDREPLARFPIDVKVNNGVMTYTLPKELVGVDNKITLNEIRNEEGARTYTGDKAFAVCMGDEKTPGCVVHHKNLAENLTAAREFNIQRFTDNNLQFQSIQVAKEFLDHSGNEPIGFIGNLVPRKVQWKVPGTETKVDGKVTAVFKRKWNSTWIFDKGASQTFDVSFGGDLLSGSTTAGGVMNVRWSQFHATGIVVSGGVKRWFDITFSADLSSFDGFIGTFVSENTKIDVNGAQVLETKREGRWRGTVAPGQ